MNFAFIYIYGEDIDLGQKLIHSIKINHPDSFIIQIADFHAKKINTVDCIERTNFYHERIMYDFVKAQRNIVNKYGPTVFLDADMIILKPITELFIIPNYEFSLTERSEESKKSYFTPIKHMDKFPELINKKFGNEMPFNAGVYFSKNTDTMEYMLSTFEKMSSNYLQWYGDQIALRELVRCNKFKIKVYDGNIYNYTPKSENENFSGKKILHFKGNRKKWLDTTFKKFFELSKTS